MPNPEKVKKAWGLPEQGEIVGNFKILSAYVGHIPIQKYREYEFPINYIIEGNGDLTKIRKIFKSGKEAIVYTSYGNPYNCEIESINIERVSRDKYRITGQGFCTRNYKLPKRR